jgi:hypothetical protein
VSAADWEEYGPVAEGLVGQTFGVGLPVNSLKLMVDPLRHRERYIWIDPPWRLSKNAAVVVASATYPPGEDAPDLEAWRRTVRSVLDGAILEGLQAQPDGSAEFAFQGAIRLCVGVGLEGRSPQKWYDDWFATL